MIWSDWNKADKTLLLALIIFFFSLCVHLQYPHSIVADGMLFCAEAALVGGIADWFAVTALFRQPLGFPYHTAILPKRRQAFIDASVTMVQREFFSRRKIFAHLDRLKLLPLLLGWLNQPETEGRLTRCLIRYGEDFLLQQDMGKQSAVLADKIRGALFQLEPEVFLRLAVRWLRQTGRDKDGLAKLTAYGQQVVGKEEARQAIQRILENYGKSQTRNPLAALLASFAEAADLVNYGEAAALIQRQLQLMLGELGTRDSALQQEMLTLFYEQLDGLADEAAIHELLTVLRDNMVRKLPLEQTIHDTIRQLKAYLLSEDREDQSEELAEAANLLQSRLEQIVQQEYRRIMILVSTDETLQRCIGDLLYDVIARSALHAQALVGVIVTKVLSRLTDEQLNHLVYDKVEPDFLWIRMNGSIVGSGIGLVLFALLQLIQN